MSSGNGRGGGGGRERRGERTRAPLRWQFWRRKALLLVLCAGQSLPQQSLAFGFFTLPRGVNVALSSRSRLPSRGGHKAVRGVAGCRTPARSRGKRTLLRAEFIEDEYARLVRRMARLERIVSGQNAEVEAMRSSMEHMRMIIQIQAQIDSCLVDGGEEGLLSTNLGGGKGGAAVEPNSRLVRQAIKLLRLRHRVLQAWEFEGDGGLERQGKDNDVDDDEDAAEALASEFRAMSGFSGLSTPPPLPALPPDESIPRNSGGGESAMRRRDGRYEDEEEYAYSMYDPLDSRAAASEERRGGVWGGRGENLGFGSSLSQQQPPKTNQDAADAAGTGVVAALMEGRRRLIVEVDDTQLRYNSPQFCHEAMAEFVELLILPLTTALENLNAEQNRCKIVIQGAHNVAHAKEAMVLDAPDSLRVVSLEDAKVSKKDRVVALVAPENWTGKKGKHLKRVLAEAHDSAIILINPTDADKFLRPADFNTFEHVYNLRPMRVNYLQPLPPPQHPPPSYGGERGESPVGLEPTGEALLLERLGESLWEEEKALAAAAAAAAAAASSSEEATENESDDAGTGASIAAAAEERVVATSPTGGEKNGDSSLIDGGTAVGAAAAAAEMGVRAAERALARAALGMGGAATSHEPDWGGLDIGYRDREWTEREDERLSNEAAEAAMAAWGVVERGAARPGDEESGDAGEEEMAWERQRWGEGELGEWRDGDEAAEMSALAVTLRQYPDAWKAFVNLHDGVGFRLCGTWDLEPPQTAVKTVVMDHILRIVMD